jgi:hypothetical protein
VFAYGTAGVITSVSHVKYCDGEPGEVTMALRDTLTGIQRGTFADKHPVGGLTERSLCVPIDFVHALVLGHVADGQ